MPPLTAAEWLKTNYPHATGWHADYATEYAEHIASFPKWVDVMDRLPETLKEVLVCRKGQLKIRAEYMVSKGWSNDVIFYQPVTHWQPLPELPKPTEHE